MDQSSVTHSTELLALLTEILRPTIFCEFENPESSCGAADGGQPCIHTATIHDIESDRDLCGKHFELKEAAL